jgi:23S rRNA-/tRNA-specific pseudouridylate synthase
MIGRGRDLSLPRDRMELTVKAHGPVRLDLYLREALVWKSRGRIQALIRAGQIQVNGAQAKPSQGVRGGDRIQVNLSMGTGMPVDYADREVSIIYEDSWLVAVDKPPGLLVHPVGRHVYDTLMNYLHYRYHGKQELRIADCGLRIGGRLIEKSEGGSGKAEVEEPDPQLGICGTSITVGHPTQHPETEEVDKPSKILGTSSSGRNPQSAIRNPKSGAQPAPGSRYRSRIDERLTIRLCHRIDKDTTGIVLVGKEGYVHKRVQWQFQTRRVSKEYLTLAAGFIPDDLDEIAMPIGEGGNLAEALAPPLKPARTTIRCLERFRGPAGDFTLVLARPVTGRQNQIRVHLAAAGFPIAGDVRYGGPAVPGFPDRYLLHARWIRFFHPRLKTFVELSAPPPADFRELIERLRADIR